MPNENDMEARREDALNAYESLFGDAEPSADDVVAKEQDAESETGQHRQDSEVVEDQAETGQEGAGESDQDPQEPDIPEKQADENQAERMETSPPDELKVVVSIKDGRATIGVQQPSSDPYIEPVGASDLSGLAGEVVAVVKRAKARWETAPKHPAYTRPAPPARRRTRREQGAAQASTAEGETAQQQPEAPRLF